MTRASKFMYLDWSVGRIVERSDGRVVAEHNGYRKLGIMHRREVSFFENIWRVEDNLQPFTLSLSKGQNFTYRLHWLLPDGAWKVKSGDEEIEISVKLQKDWMKLRISQFSTLKPRFSIARAGKLLYGNAETTPTRGWYSPTYGVKTPALSLVLEVRASDDVKFLSEFKLPPP